MRKDNSKARSKNKVFAFRIAGVAILALLLSFLVIPLVDHLFRVPGSSITALESIGAGDVLTYMGGVLTCIATLILSYLVYKIEQNNRQMELERTFPCLTVSAFNEDPMILEEVFQSSIDWNSITPDNFFVASPSTGSFIPSIVITNGKSPTKCSKIKQYIIGFQYTGDIRCKVVSIDRICLYTKESTLAVDSCCNYKYPTILSNGDTICFYLYYISENTEEVTNGKIRIEYSYTTLKEQQGTYEVEIEKQQIPLCISRPDLRRNGEAEVLKTIHYIKEPEV